MRQFKFVPYIDDCRHKATSRNILLNAAFRYICVTSVYDHVLHFQKMMKMQKKQLRYLHRVVLNVQHQQQVKKLNIFGKKEFWHSKTGILGPSLWSDLTKRSEVRLLSVIIHGFLQIGGLIIASLFEILVGASGLVGLLLRFVGPLTVAPVLISIGISLAGPAIA